MVILSSNLSEYYKEEFEEAAREIGNIEIKYFNPDEINIVFGNPSKIYNQDGTELIVDAFMVRATNTLYKEYALISKALESQGCIMLDPSDRFSGHKPNKNMSSIKRATNGSGIQVLKFSNNFIRNFPDKIIPFLPAFIKPIDGKRNSGLVIANTIDELIQYNNDNYIIQPKVNIDDEFRVLAYNYGDGNIKVLGITHKKTIGLMGANPKKKYIIKEQTKSNLINFILNNSEVRNNKGLFGYDIAKLQNSLVLIEANRSPMWERTERIRNNNVAKEILLILKEQYDSKQQSGTVR